jgi:succinyl-diaminopimelate desuccinylase
MVTLTRDLVEIPSTESQPDERRRAFRMCRNHLEAIPGLDFHEGESEGYESLVALPRGLREPAIMLVAHLDVIDHPDETVFRTGVCEGRIVGPGAGDMKGQCAILLQLFVDLQRRHPGLPVGIALTSDEERGGENGVGWLFGEAGWRCGIAIVPDGGSMNDITVAEKGILHLRLRSQGRESHAARPWLVSNALVEMNRALTALDGHFSGLADPACDSHWYPTCVPTILRTRNETINCIPGEVEAYLDVRFPPPDTVATTLNKVRKLAGPAVEVEMLVGAESSHLAPDPLFLEVTRELTGQPVREVRASGGSDARFIAACGIPVILARPKVGNLHGVDEWIDIDSMGCFYRICRTYMERKLRVE